MTERADQLHHDDAPAHSTALVQAFYGKSHHPGLSAPSYSQDLTHCDFWVFPKLKSPCSHSTQSQSVASHYWLTSPTGEWLFMDAQESLLWLAAKLHRDHMTGSRDIHNGWILSGQTSYLYWKRTWHWGVVQQIIRYGLCTTEGTRMTRLVAVVRMWIGKINVSGGACLCFQFGHQQCNEVMWLWTHLREGF
jgi:hypothetical protein